MKYRKFGNTDFDVSVLAFDTKHLCSMNKDEAIRVVQCAVDNGINYFSLYNPYDIRVYERILEIISESLQGGCRREAKISVTFPINLIESVSDLDYYLERYLKVLCSSKIDFCLLGELNRETWLKVQKLNVLDWIDNSIREGKIERAGFSFHDDFPILRDIISSYKKWSFCQFRYNYVDVNHHPGVTGLKYAARNGLAIIVEDPFKEGNLLKNPPEPVIKAWGELISKGSLAEWGLRWLWNHPEISTVIIDIDGIERMLEYVALTEKSDPDNLSIQELIVFDNVRDVYLKIRPINCALCRCCMPCPQKVDVPRIFELYNDGLTYNDIETARFHYKIEQHKIENCNACGECEDKCPREIPILNWLKRARDLLAS